jgi:hypothetical protein
MVLVTICDAKKIVVFHGRTRIINIEDFLGFHIFLSFLRTPKSTSSDSMSNYNEIFFDLLISLKSLVHHE